jgi:hypothetical protein
MGFHSVEYLPRHAFLQLEPVGERLRKPDQFGKPHCPKVSWGIAKGHVSRKGGQVVFASAGKGYILQDYWASFQLFGDRLEIGSRVIAVAIEPFSPKGGYPCRSAFNFGRTLLQPKTG